MYRTIYAEDARPGKTIYVGLTGENKATKVYFPKYMKGYSSVISILRQGDELPYSVEAHDEGDYVSWIITSTDAAKDGKGTVEVHHTKGDVIIKDGPYNFEIKKSHEEEGEMPDPYQSWYQEVLNTSAEAFASKQIAEASAENAVNSAALVVDIKKQIEDKFEEARDIIDNANSKLEEIETSLSAKANSNDVDDKLELKADKSDLLLKADLDYLNNQLELKVDLSDFEGSMASKIDSNEAWENFATKTDFDLVSTELERKSDLSYLDSQLLLKADAATVNDQINLKADASYVDYQLSIRPDNTVFNAAMSSKANTADVEAALNLKADKTYTDNKLSQKADTAYVDSSLVTKANVAYVESELSNKATATDLNNKADKTYVDNQLSKKANSDYVDDMLSIKANYLDVQNALNTKADISIAYAKYDKPDSGIPESDLSDAVKTKLNSGSAILDVKFGGKSVVSNQIADIVGNVFWCEYAITSYEEITRALEDNMIPMCYFEGILYIFSVRSFDHYILRSVYENSSLWLKIVNDSTWSAHTSELQTKDNLTTELSHSSNDIQYPSAKAVFDAIPKIKWELIDAFTTTEDVGSMVIRKETSNPGQFKKLMIVYDNPSISSGQNPYCILKSENASERSAAYYSGYSDTRFGYVVFDIENPIVQAFSRSSINPYGAVNSVMNQNVDLKVPEDLDYVFFATNTSSTRIGAGTNFKIYGVRV